MYKSNNNDSTPLKIKTLEAVDFLLVVKSCSIPRWENLPGGHQRYPLLVINLGYMYWGQKHVSE